MYSSFNAIGVENDKIVLVVDDDEEKEFEEASRWSTILAARSFLSQIDKIEGPFSLILSDFVRTVNFAKVNLLDVFVNDNDEKDEEGPIHIMPPLFPHPSEYFLVQKLAEGNEISNALGLRARGEENATQDDDDVEAVMVVEEVRSWENVEVSSWHVKNVPSVSRINAVDDASKGKRRRAFFWKEDDDDVDAVVPVVAVDGDVVEKFETVVELLPPPLEKDGDPEATEE